MKNSGITMRRGLFGAFAGCLLGGVAAATVTVPSASAAPSACSAAGLSGTISSVSGGVSQYLEAHPGADQALTNAANQPTGDAEASVRAYFTANPNEYLDLKGITAPLNNVQSQCNISITPSQAIAAYQAFQAG